MQIFSSVLGIPKHNNSKTCLWMTAMWRHHIVVAASARVLERKFTAYGTAKLHQAPPSPAVLSSLSAPWHTIPTTAHDIPEHHATEEGMGPHLIGHLQGLRARTHYRHVLLGRRCLEPALRQQDIYHPRMNSTRWKGSTLSRAAVKSGGG